MQQFLVTHYIPGVIYWHKKYLVENIDHSFA